MVFSLGLSQSQPSRRRTVPSGPSNQSPVRPADARNQELMGNSGAPNGTTCAWLDAEKTLSLRREQLRPGVRPAASRSQEKPATSHAVAPVEIAGVVHTL